MKTLFASLAVIALLATPVVSSAQSSSQSATVYKGNAPSAQTNVINKNEMEGVTAVNAGKNNQMDFGVVSNKGGGAQTNVINQNKVKNSQFINAGEGNEMHVGGVYNE